MHPSFSLSLLFAGLLLAGCDQLPSSASAAAPKLSLSPWGASSQLKAEDLRFAGEQAEGQGSGRKDTVHQRGDPFTGRPALPGGRAGQCIRSG